MNPEEFANIARSEQEFWWYRGMRDILFRLLDPIAREETFERVVEAGCGTGHLSSVLAERYGWNMFPLDLGSEGLKYAREFGLGQLTQGDITSLPFANESFDALLSIDVLPHLPKGSEITALAEFARVVRPGGLLVIRAAALDILRSRHSQFAHERQRFTRGRLSKLVESAGFEIERLTYANSLLMPLALFKFRVWEPITRQAAQSGVQPVAKWLDESLYRPLKAEASWIGRGRSLPTGQSLVLVARRNSPTP